MSRSHLSQRQYQGAMTATHRNLASAAARPQRSKDRRAVIDYDR